MKCFELIAVMDTHPQLYKNTNSILNAPTAGPTIVNPKFFSINDEVR